MTGTVVRRLLLGLVLPLAATLLTACQPGGRPTPPTAPSPGAAGGPVTPPAPPDAPPTGGVDSWDVRPAAVVHGWAFDPDAGPNPVQVLVSLGGNLAPMLGRADLPSQARAGLIGPNHNFSVDVSKHLALIPVEKRSAVPVKVYAVNARADGTVNLEDRVTIHDKAIDFSGAAGGAEVRRSKVECWLFDPELKSKGGKRASEVYGWPSPKAWSGELANGLAAATGGAVEFQIVGGGWMDEWPRLVDPLAAPGATVLWTEKDLILEIEPKEKVVDPRQFDAYEFLKRRGTFERLQKREIDEVWFVGLPFPSTPALRAGGRGSARLVKLPITEDVVDRPFFMLSFDARRGLDEAVRTLGERTTACLDSALGAAQDSPWATFTATDAERPGKAGAGRFDQPPNAKERNDFTNATFVSSNCDAFRLEYPQLTRAPRKINRDEWGGTPAGYRKWWLKQIPHQTGRANGKSNDWWSYVVDPAAP